MKKAADTVKMALIFVLVASLVCLSLFYINLFGGDGGYTFTPQMDEAVREQLYKASYAGKLGGELVSPYFIGLVGGSGKSGYVSRAALVYSLGISDVVTELMGPDADFSANDEAPDFIDYDGAYIYVRFRTELPRKVIYYCQKPDSIMDDVGDEYVYDMFIVPSERGTTAYMRDLRGNNFTSFTEYRINENRFSAYTESGGDFRFEFAHALTVDAAKTLAGYYEKIDKYEIIPEKDLSAMSAVVANGDEIAPETVLRVFGQNPEKVTVYEGDDGTTFFDEGINVKISKDGSITYSALSEQYGIGISDVIGYDFDEGDYTVTDFVGAALVLGERLGVFDSGAFGTAITCCEEDGNRAFVAISYVYDGFSILSGGRCALEAEFGGGNIVSVKCIALKAQEYDGKTEIDELDWRIRAALAEKQAPFYIDFIQSELNDRLYLMPVLRAESEAEK